MTHFALFIYFTAPALVALTAIAALRTPRKDRT